GDAPRAEDLAKVVPTEAPPASTEAAVVPAALRPEPPVLGDAKLDPRRGRLVAPLGEGRAVLTIDPRLQERLERSLQNYRVPWGATVMLEAGSGRVLALAEHSDAEPARKGLALAPIAPAASVFKIVTAAALLERGVGPTDPVCYHGGKRRLQPRLLADDPRRDRRCVSLAQAFGHSTNVVFAKLADRDLDAQALRATAERFLFNVPIAFPRAVEPSPANIPDDPFGLANAAAGFGDVRLSPLHAALLASVVANGGLLVPPVLVDDVEGAPLVTPPAPWRVVDENVASELGTMMRSTVTAGTARRVFRRTASGLRGVAVAGKTGSLADPSPFRDYTWFVGFAPAEKPEVVVASVVVNGRLWHARAPMVAKEALEAFFATRVASLPPGAVKTASAH
ncbi:MAG TPA: penicillin-binding transpeptidase domain-containing protein, partial [Anaeromyxobacter sp.]|nr:penicillin-binding transpeptidase domain-containing protein [Anaeromyxobacter sp.]